MLRQKFRKGKSFRANRTFVIAVAAEQFRMNPFLMRSQMRFRHVILSAQLALIGPASGVRIFVNVQLDLAEKSFSANLAAYEKFLRMISPFVQIQIVLRITRKVANVARVITLVRMQFHVSREDVGTFKLSVAHGAGIRLVDSVFGFTMTFVIGSRIKKLLAYFAHLDWPNFCPGIGFFNGQFNFFYFRGLCNWFRIFQHIRVQIISGAYKV